MIYASYNSYENDYMNPHFKIETVEDAVNIAACQLSNIGESFEQEGLFVITMSEKNEVKTVRLLALGDFNTIKISSNEICKQAIRDDAKNILILHNHPRSNSGSLIPSEADIRVTDVILQGCSLLQLRLLDHIIVSSTFQKDHKFYSMRQDKVIDFDYYFKPENLDFCKNASELKWR